MAYFNFSVSRSKGKLYMKSKTPLEGYEEVKYGTGDEKSVTYHKYVDKTQGIVTSFGVNSFQYGGKTIEMLELTLKDGEDINKVAVPLYSTNGYTEEAKALISAMRGYELNEAVTVAPKVSNYTSKSGKQKTALNIYVNYVNKLNEQGRGLSTGFIAFSEIPPAEVKVVAGKNKYDYAPQTEFFYQQMQAISARVSDSSSQSAPAHTSASATNTNTQVGMQGTTVQPSASPPTPVQQQQDPQAQQNAVTPLVEEYDDLPF